MDLQGAVNHGAQYFGVQDIQFTKLAMLAAGLWMVYGIVSKAYRTGKSAVVGAKNVVTGEKFRFRNIVAVGQLTAGMGLIAYGIGEYISWKYLGNVSPAHSLMDFSSHSIARATTSIGTGLSACVASFWTADNSEPQQTA